MTFMKKDKTRKEAFRTILLLTDRRTESVDRQIIKWLIESRIYLFIESFVLLYTKLFEMRAKPFASRISLN